MQPSELTSIRVAAVRELSACVKLFTLESTDGGLLPAFTTGSHLIITMTDADGTWSNAYSILSSPLDTRQYRIAVRRETPSRGGSSFMHQKVGAGSILTVSGPANLFPLAGGAARHVLIGAGIGITPMLAHVAALQASGSEYELHYCIRHERDCLFRAELEPAARSGRLHVHVSSGGHRLDVARLFDGLARDAHVYVCGPAGLNTAVFEAARLRGWPQAQLHAEQFATADTAGGAFSVVLARQGLRVQVGANQTILEALERASVGTVSSLCREGYCGTCETGLLEGEADHRDQYLPTEQRQAQRSIMICVSRARTPTLVLNL